MCTRIVSILRHFLRIKYTDQRVLARCIYAGGAPGLLWSRCLVAVARSMAFGVVPSTFRASWASVKHVALLPQEWKKRPVAYERCGTNSKTACFLKYRIPGLTVTEPTGSGTPPTLGFGVWRQK